MSARHRSPRGSSSVAVLMPRRLVRGLLGCAVLATTSGCQQLTNPAAQAELQESLYQLQDLLAQMREETATLQWQVDSLQGVVARQDTSLRRLANQLGMPMP